MQKFPSAFISRSNIGRTLLGDDCRDAGPANYDVYVF
jgi:hypothetical protein